MTQGKWQRVAALIVWGCALGLRGAAAAQGTDATAESEGSHAKAAAIVAKMLEKNRERAAALESYSSDRTYRVEYNGTGGHHAAEIRVHAEYTIPEHKQLTVVAESGSKFICEKVLRKLVEGEQEASDRSNRAQTSLGPENYDAELVGEETVSWPGLTAGTDAGVRAWVLKVTPKVDNKFTYKGRVWVSQEDYAVIRVQGEPAKSPSWWINRATLDSRYVRRGDVWLPGQNVSTSHVRIGGEAKLTIDYGSYPEVAARRLGRDADTAQVSAQRPKVVDTALAAAAEPQTQDRR